MLSGPLRDGSCVFLLQAGSLGLCPKRRVAGQDWHGIWDQTELGSQFLTRCVTSDKGLVLVHLHMKVTLPPSRDPEGGIECMCS